MSTQTAYLVERHDDYHYGPHREEIAADADAALQVADEMIDEHEGERWDMRVKEPRGRMWVTFSPTDDGRGYVTIKKKDLHRR
jgi:hypothetical protein